MKFRCIFPWIDTSMRSDSTTFNLDERVIDLAGFTINTNMCACASPYWLDWPGQNGRSQPLTSKFAFKKYQSNCCVQTSHVCVEAIGSPLNPALALLNFHLLHSLDKTWLTWINSRRQNRRQIEGFTVYFGVLAGFSRTF